MKTADTEKNYDAALEKYQRAYLKGAPIDAIRSAILADETINDEQADHIISALLAEV